MNAGAQSRASSEARQAGYLDAASRPRRDVCEGLAGRQALQAGLPAVALPRLERRIDRVVSPLTRDVVQKRFDLCRADRLRPIPDLPAAVVAHDARDMSGTTGRPLESADQRSDRHLR